MEKQSQYEVPGYDILIETTTKDVLTFVLTTLTEAESAGLTLPQARQRLIEAAGHTYGLEPEYLEALAEERDFEAWISRAADLLPAGTVLGERVDSLRVYYDEGWTPGRLAELVMGKEKEQRTALAGLASTVVSAVPSMAWAAAPPVISISTGTTATAPVTCCSESQSAGCASVGMG